MHETQPNPPTGRDSGERGIDRDTVEQGTLETINFDMVWVGGKDVVSSNERLNGSYEDGYPALGK